MTQRPDVNRETHLELFLLCNSGRAPLTRKKRRQLLNTKMVRLALQSENYDLNENDLKADFLKPMSRIQRREEHGVPFFVPDLAQQIAMDFNK